MKGRIFFVLLCGAWLYAPTPRTDDAKALVESVLVDAQRTPGEMSKVQLLAHLEVMRETHRAELERLRAEHRSTEMMSRINATTTGAAIRIAQDMLHIIEGKIDTFRLDARDHEDDVRAKKTLLAKYREVIARRVKREQQIGAAQAELAWHDEKESLETDLMRKQVAHGHTKQALNQALVDRDLAERELVAAQQAARMHKKSGGSSVLAGTIGFALGAMTASGAWMLKNAHGYQYRF